MRSFQFTLVVAFLACPLLAADKTETPAPTPQAAMLNSYFERQVTSLEGQLDREVKTKEDWLAKKDQYRRELQEMLGLYPMPPRTDLHVTKTGEFEHEDIVVENLHYQSMPGLYVTAALYHPKVDDKPLPAILFVCGHSNAVKNGIIYGNKATHQSHALWYAKHGFVCMVIDTVQLGEIKGEHHGTARLGRWWWFARGYTPGGAEAWAGIRGLDYLETRPDVDKTRFGVTGMSGGGAYSWWIAALDERIKAAVPTSGITDLRNYVVDGAVEHHCDCMFFVNTYRWDYDKVAALVAPRALCIANPDKDMYFPIDGVFRVYQHARRIYKLLGAEDQIGIQFDEGPHTDTEPLNTGEFCWMMRFLQGADRNVVFEPTPTTRIEIEKLRVFKDGLPKDERVSTIDESFVPMAATPQLPADAMEWAAQRKHWMEQLRAKCFAGWAKTQPPAAKMISSSEKDGLAVSVYEIKVDDVFPLKIWLLHAAGLKLKDLDEVDLNTLDEQDWPQLASGLGKQFPHLFPGARKIRGVDVAKNEFENSKRAIAYFCPRGVGPTAWEDNVSKTPNPKALTPADLAHLQRLRRFYLIGQTLDGQQVWDIRCAIHALRSIDGLTDTKLSIAAAGSQSGNALYAGLFEDRIARIDLYDLPHSHRHGPIYLNVLKYLDLPQAVAMAAEKSRVIIHDEDQLAWKYAKDVSEKLGWGKDEARGLELKDSPKPATPSVKK